MNPLRLLSRGFVFAALGLALVAGPGGRAAEKATSANGTSRRAGLGPRESDLRLEFPDAAWTRGITQGRADVCVLVDGQGRALDFLVTSETDPAFGRALLDYLRTADFQPALQQGVPVPARCAFTYEFVGRGAVGLNAIDASAARVDLGGKPKLVRAPVTEAKLDHPIEVIAGSVPTLPADFPATDKPVKVSVTFFVDETGQVWAPNIESDSPPQVYASVIAAVSTWKCKPPTAGGKPALVFAGRTFAVPRAPQ